ncbi:DBF4-type zinc finger-containing protein 2 [Melanotaenia boesemani]|uniref:DBF4-type zinc finger-containing protein 2 n=1 Tax=Melanotaenia boesemani TaxID=1250792 RepID=UPI001C057298|nr:DBF4-type zinc finger-containing protein 2 [Melanotaenia boesemani]XP_041834695.1 DBF4-type zinc finger-containing protein 2 [Melanotaenia boesemani]
MSRTSNEDDQRKAEPPTSMWEESQPGPSRCEPGRQGYCGYCRVLYSNLDQHLSSLRHLDSVRTSSRGSSTTSSACSRTRLTLMERFLQDVLQHHPHRYSDSRPSHADLPSVSAPPLPRAELDELCFSDDSRSLGTRELLPSSGDVSCQPADQEDLSSPIRAQEGGSAPPGSTCVSQPRATLPHHQAPPSVHTKAHRKTNRRKSSDSLSKSSRGPGSEPDQDLSLRKRQRSTLDLRPWLSWQRERREAHREEAFSSDHTDPMDQTIEEVIQIYCHGTSFTPHHQEEVDSLHFSLPVSIETQSEDWDSPVQVVFQQGTDTPVQVTQTAGRDLSRLVDLQVHLEDQTYSHQLDSALHSKSRRGGARQDEGFLTLPIEEVLPVPEHIPDSFRGKTWAQIEQEDEKRVERLVRQFRRGRFLCYFDTESLARYGRRSQNKTEAEPDSAVLPLVDHDGGDSLCVRKRSRRRWSFRLASRCQVVKVSHSTQTVQLLVPSVHHLCPEAPPTAVPEANQGIAEQTPEMQTRRCLPPSYSNIFTPVQPRTSLVYLLCSPSGSAPSTPENSTPKRSRKRRRPLELQGLKLKYRRLPVRFYEPGTNRILKNPPRGLRWHRGSAPSGPSPPCVRQLFRSLSPDLNTDKPAGEGPKGDSFLRSTLRSDSAQANVVQRPKRTSQAPPPMLDGRSEQVRRSRRERRRPPPSKRRTRSLAQPPPPRREGLRQAASRTLPSFSCPTPISTRRGRGRRGRGYERAR